MKRFKNILVVVDEASAYEHALDRVAWLAKMNEARVTLIDTIDTEPGELSRLFATLPGRRGKEVEDSVIARRKERLADVAQSLRAGGATVETDVLQGIPFVRIIQRVMAKGHDLVIKGAQRTPGQAFFRGPDMHLMRKCPCPVWVLNTAAEARSRRILAAVDPEQDAGAPDRASLSRMVMQLATSLAWQDHARIDVLNVWRLEEEGSLRHPMAKVPPEDIAALLRKTETSSRDHLDTLVAEFNEFKDLMRVLHIKGLASDVIPAHVEDEGIDTVVMGTVGRTGIAGVFIGNTAETVLSRVKCSVLAVKPEGFVSPVAPEGAA